ncbi:MAG: HAD-IA family hydrolase [Spirochaetales bacterium]|nr:HAD-IA family hydrolase [Spirochaetales bacterium]
MIEAVLFDMDGVLVDSEEFICKAAMAYFAENEIDVKESDFIPFIGAGEDRYIGGVAEKYNFKIDIDKAKARTYKIYGDIVKGQLDALDGAADFIEKCKNKGLKTALATSADYTKMVINLEEIGLPLQTFDAVVNGLDIEHKKPAPDIYLKAAKMLGVKPEHCLVVEDAVNGVAAALAAGSRCLGITSSFSEKQLKGASWFAENLTVAPYEAISW